MSSFELRTSLPCNEVTWEASSAEEWWKHARPEPQISYLTVLRAYVNPDLNATIPDLNTLSRLLVLHGLLSIQWDMKRRDQASLGMSSNSLFKPVKSCPRKASLLTLSDRLRSEPSQMGRTPLPLLRCLES